MKTLLFLIIGLFFSTQLVFAQVKPDQWITQDQIDNCALFNGVSLIIVKFRATNDIINNCGSVMDKAIEKGYTIKTDILGATALGEGCGANCAITKLILLEKK